MASASGSKDILNIMRVWMVTFCLAIGGLLSCSSPQNDHASKTAHPPDREVRTTSCDTEGIIRHALAAGETRLRLGVVVAASGLRASVLAGMENAAKDLPQGSLVDYLVSQSPASQKARVRSLYSSCRDRFFRPWKRRRTLAAINGIVVLSAEEYAAIFDRPSGWIDFRSRFPRKALVKLSAPCCSRDGRFAVVLRYWGTDTLMHKMRFFFLARHEGHWGTLASISF